MAAIERLRDGFRTVVWGASTTSGEVEIRPGSVGSLYIPATFSSTSVSFQVQEADGTWVDLYYDGSLVSIGVTAGKRNGMPVELFLGSGPVKFKLDQTETGVGKYYPVQ